MQLPSSFARLLDIGCGPIPIGNFFPMPIFPLLEHKIGIFVRFCQQVSSRWLPRPATNLIWRRSTPVWLAIWRIWAGFANSQLLPDAAAGALSRALGAESTAERQLFRTDFRFAPSPRRASLAVPPIHEGHGRPRSVRKSSRLRWKHLSAR